MVFLSVSFEFSPTCLVLCLPFVYVQPSLLSCQVVYFCLDHRRRYSSLLLPELFPRKQSTFSRLMFNRAQPRVKIMLGEIQADDKQAGRERASKKLQAKKNRWKTRAIYEKESRAMRRDEKLVRISYDSLFPRARCVLSIIVFVFPSLSHCLIFLLSSPCT